MKRITGVLLAIATLLLLCSPLVSSGVGISEIQAAKPSANVIKYIPDEDWDNSSLTYDEKYGKAHTIHWLTGINPPVIGHEIEAPANRNTEKAGKFHHEYSKFDHVDYYLAPYVPGNGWYDVNKKVAEGGGGEDSRSCFALASVNLLHWWMDQNSEYIQQYLEIHPSERLESFWKNTDSQGNPQPVEQYYDTSHLYAQLIKPTYQDHKGGWPHKVMDYVLNGYSSPAHSDYRNRPEDFPEEPAADGGFFYDVFEKSILTDHVGAGNFKNMSKQFPEYLDNGIGMIAVMTFWSGTHAMTIWGAEYDENDQLCAVYLVDNNDNDREKYAITDTKEMHGMIRYNAFQDKKNGLLRLTSYTDYSYGSSQLLSYSALTLGRDGWAHWEKVGKPLYEDGQAFLHPQKYVCSNHQFIYAERGSQIVRICSACGHEEWVGIKIRDGEPLIYTGTQITPCVMMSSLGGSYPFIPNTIRYSSNIDAGTGLATMTYKVGDITYTARLEFTIKPKPVEAPTVAPVLKSRSPYSVSVQPVLGLEFSIDGKYWTSDGLFQGLEPDTAYTVSVRSVAPEDKNYTASLPGRNVLSIHTQKEDTPLGDPDWSISSLSHNQVEVINTGKKDKVTLIIAGYDRQGRQTFLQTESVTSVAGQALTISFTDSSVLHKAFLIGGDHVPVAPICKTQ